MISHDVRRILLVGNDWNLLKQRVYPLSRSGAQVVVSGPSELETHLGKETFDLVILCHSLPDLLRRAATENARKRWPAVKVMQLFERTGDLASIGCPLDDRSSDEPDELVRHAEELLKRTA